MSLQGKHIAILAEDDYEDLELWYPLIRLKEEGAEVHVVGPKQQSYKSKHGYPVEVDLTLDEAQPSEFDAVIIPGGYAPDRMRRHPALLAFVRDIYQQGKPLAAICHAPWVLASAGVARQHRLTSFFSLKDDMVNAGAEWVDEEVVVDRNLVTSRSPDDLPAFCREVIKLVSQAGEQAKAA
jgi:protease I